MELSFDGKIREIAVVVVALVEECVTPFSIVQKVKFHMCELEPGAHLN